MDVIQLSYKPVSKIRSNPVQCYMVQGDKAAHELTHAMIGYECEVCKSRTDMSSCPLYIDTYFAGICRKCFSWSFIVLHGIYETNWKLKGGALFVLSELPKRFLDFLQPASAYVDPIKHIKSTSSTDTSVMIYEAKKAIAQKNNPPYLSSMKSFYFNATYNDGINFVLQGQYREAVRLFTGAIKLDPQSYLAWFNRASAREEIGDIVGAMGDYDEAIRVNPKHPDAYFNRALLRNNNSRQEIDDYTTCIKLNPNLIDAYLNRASCYYAKGVYVAALADYKAVLKIMPSHPQARAMSKKISFSINQ